MSNSLLHKVSLLEKTLLKLSSDYLELKESLDTLLTHISEGILFFNCKGEIVVENGAAKKMLAGSVITDNFFGFSLKEGSFKTKRGMMTIEEKEIEVSATQIPQKGIVVVLRDVSEMLRIKRASERNERLKEVGEMAARFAHEIRNPLGGVEGFAELLFQELREDPKLSEWTSSILEGTRLVHRLIDKTLTYARPLKAHFKECDLVECAKEAFLLAQADDRSKRKYLLDLPESCPIMGDGDLIKLALLNLMKNAKEAESPSISLVLKRGKTRARLSVVDRGKGIALKEREKIFTPFYSTKVKGSGIGLSEANKIATLHGGLITCKSKKNDKTTFTLELPYG